VVVDRWVLGIGATYTMDALVFGLGYSINDPDIDDRGADNSHFKLQGAAFTVNYTVGPGIDVDGEIAYTRQGVSGSDFSDDDDNDDALELGMPWGRELYFAALATKAC
jgi:outer membrane protein OmpU